MVKYLLQNRLAIQLKAFSETLYIIDPLPIPVCKFARAHFSKIFKGILLTEVFEKLAHRV